MKRNIWWLVLLATLLIINPVWSDEGFYVIGGGGGVGTKISSLPCKITSPGFYYVTRNLTGVSGQHGIIVDADNVTIDLMGFCLTGMNQPDIDGITTKNAHTNVEIRNGALGNWYAGIRDNGGGKNWRVFNIRMTSCHHGIILAELAGGGALVKGCTIEVAGVGISAFGVISENVVSNAENGIESVSTVFPLHPTTTTITRNMVTNCGTGIWTGTGSIIGNSVLCHAQTQIGIFISGNDANSPVLLDQNSVNGPGTHFTHWGDYYTLGTNAGF